MIQITAKRNGDYSAVSRQANINSATTLVFKLDGIDIADITGVEYQLGEYNSRITKTIGNGVELLGDSINVSLGQDDLKTKGLLRQYLQITDSTGTYTATLNVGRLKVR